MQEGMPGKRDTVWLVVCQDTDSPDGPADFIGPYSDREYCLLDLEANPNCNNTHWFGHQKWGDLVERFDQRNDWPVHLYIRWRDFEVAPPSTVVRRDVLR